MNKTDKFRLLVVDDEESILKMFGEIFEPQGEGSKHKAELQEIEAELFNTTASSADTQFSYTLTYCKQGEEAVEEVRRSIEEDVPFSVIFLDMRLPPGRDGLWTAENIRVIDPEVNIVIVTGFSDVDPDLLNERVTPTNRLLYVKKPVKPQEIRQFADSLTKNWLVNKNTTRILGKLRTKVLKHEIKEFSDDLNAELGERSGAELPDNLKQIEVNVLQNSLYRLKQSLQRELEKLSEASQLLSQKEKELEESNITIKVLLQQQHQNENFDERNKELNKRILFNILEIVEPYIEKLENSDLKKKQREYLSILRQNLNNLTTPTIKEMLGGEFNFSSNEVKIINLIKHGKTSKEIALLFNLSSRTIEYHRDRIRRKLGLTGSRGTSLNTYLRGLDL